ncbi:hypothetical protein ABPG74_018233 [Tetrahymena malaccensis]
MLISSFSYYQKCQLYMQIYELIKYCKNKQGNKQQEKQIHIKQEQEARIFNKPESKEFSSEKRMVNSIKLQVEYDLETLCKHIEDFALDFCKSIGMNIDKEIYYGNNKNIQLIQLHFDMIQRMINEQATQTKLEFDNHDEQDIIQVYIKGFRQILINQIAPYEQNRCDDFLNELQNNEYTWLFHIYHLILLFNDFQQSKKNSLFETFINKIKEYHMVQNLIEGVRVDQEINAQTFRSRSDDDMGNLSKMLDVSYFEQLISQKDQKIQQLMKQEEELNNEISKLKALIDQQNNQIQQQESHIQSLEQTHQELIDDNNLKSEEVNKLSIHQKEFQNLKEVTESQSEALQQSEKKIKMLEEQIRKDQEELQIEKRKFQTLNSKLKDLDLIKQYQNQITDLKSVNQSIQQKSDNYQKSLDQLKQKLEKEAKEKQTLIEQIRNQKTQMQIELEEKQSMIQKQNDQIEQNETEKIKLSQKIKEYENTYLDQKKEIESLRCQINQNLDKQTFLHLENSPTKLDLEILGVQSRKNSLNYTGQNIGQIQHLSRFNNSNFKLSNKLQDAEGTFESPLSSQRSNMGSSRQADNLNLNQQLELLKEQEDTINTYKNKLREQSETIQEQHIEIKRLQIKLKEAEQLSSENIPTNLIEISREYRKQMAKYRKQEQELEQLKEELSNQQQYLEDEEYEFEKKILAQQEIHKNEILQKDEEIKLLTSAIYELRMENIQRQNNQRLKAFLKKLQIDPMQDNFSTEISTQSSSQ